MKQNNTSFGSRLTQARKEVGMSQRDLARVSGISQPTIQRIETGAREPSLLQLSALAFGCGVSVETLRGSSPLREEVRVAGRTNDAGSDDLAEYLLYALELSRELDEIGIPRR